MDSQVMNTAIEPSLVQRSPKLDGSMSVKTRDTTIVMCVLHEMGTHSEHAQRVNRTTGFDPKEHEPFVYSFRCLKY